MRWLCSFRAKCCTFAMRLPSSGAWQNLSNLFKMFRLVFAVPISTLEHGFRLAFTLHPQASARLTLCIRSRSSPPGTPHLVPIARAWLPGPATAQRNAQPSRFNDMHPAANHGIGHPRQKPRRMPIASDCEPPHGRTQDEGTLCPTPGMPSASCGILGAYRPIRRAVVWVSTWQEPAKCLVVQSAGSGYASLGSKRVMACGC